MDSEGGHPRRQGHRNSITFAPIKRMPRKKWEVYIFYPSSVKDGDLTPLDMMSTALKSYVIST